MKTYTDVMAQIQKLTKEAERLRAVERVHAIVQCRLAIETYGITWEELTAAPAPAKPKRKSPTPRAEGTKRAFEVKYADKHGNTWIGYGHRPDWVHDYVNGGGDLEDLRVKQKAKGK